MNVDCKYMVTPTLIHLVNIVQQMLFVLVEMYFQRDLI